MSATPKIKGRDLVKVANQIRTLGEKQISQEIVNKVLALADKSGTIAVLGLIVGEVLGLFGKLYNKFKHWIETGMFGLGHINKIVEKLREAKNTFISAADLGKDLVKDLEALGAESKE